ncbi:MAG TPA: TetR/AcrR family transcriptional regulator [Thermoleophilaceae bacterium]|jgi:AcrR family transcriptional regulator
MPARAYRSQRRQSGSAATKERIVAAVRDLLEEGVFHESTVEEVAERAGVSRATLYQHFGSRLELIDAICDTMGANPELLRIREVVELPDPDEALVETIAGSARFWASEDGLLSQLYGVVAVDPAAERFVERQWNDRRGELERLVRHLRKAGRLRKGLGESRALALLLLLTSYDTFRELRRAGLSDRELVKTLQESAHETLLG